MGTRRPRGRPLPRLWPRRSAPSRGRRRAARAVPAAAARLPHPARRAGRGRGARFSHRSVGAQLGRRGLRRRDRGGARGRSRAGTSTRRTSCSTSRRRFAGDPAALARGARAAPAPAAAALRRARLGDRLGVARSSSCAPRAAARDEPIKGTRPAGVDVDGREGRGRARDDRRPRAQRPRPCLRARQRSVGPS